MVGTLSHGIRFGILWLCLFASTARADVPVTSYDCSPGTPVKGVGCTCPKLHTDGKPYVAKRDPADEGKAICVAGAKAPGNPTPPKASSYDALVMQGNDAADAYNCAKAEELYSKALAINPKGLEALVGSGNCMAKQSKWTNAQARFDKALSINPKYEPALWSKAEAYRLAYRKDDAIAAYRQYLDAYPNAYKAKQALDKLGANNPPPQPIVERPPPVKLGRIPTRTQDVVVSITGSTITANGVALNGNTMVSDWIAVYGKPDRLWDTGGVNKIHTWDKLGLIIYEPVGKPGRAGSVTFVWKPIGIKYDPATMFGGSLIVDGFAMTSSTQLGAVKARPGATQPYGAGSVVFVKGAFNVFTASKDGPLDLVELAMWKTEGPVATTPPTTNPSSMAAASVKIEVSSAGSVKAQGQELGGTPTVADFKRLYGEPDRVWDKKGAVNRIHIWDSLGFVVYEPVGTGRAATLSLPYKPLSVAEYSPNTLFKGRVSLDGKGFYNFNTIGTIVKRPGATQPYGTDSVMFDFGTIHIFTKAAKPTGETINVVEISFWQKKK